MVPARFINTDRWLVEAHFSIRNPEQCHPQSPDFFQASTQAKNIAYGIVPKTISNKGTPTRSFGSLFMVFRRAQNKTLTIK